MSKLLPLNLMTKCCQKVKKKNKKTIDIIIKKGYNLVISKIATFS